MAKFTTRDAFDEMNGQENTKSNLSGEKSHLESTIAQNLAREARSTTSDEIDPYAKPKARSTPSSKKTELVNSSYSNVLLEKILDSNNKPEFNKATLNYQTESLRVLTSIENMIKDKFYPKQKEIQAKEEEAKKQSSLAMNLGNLNIPGIMKDLQKGMLSATGTSDSLEMMKGMKELLGAVTMDGGLTGIIKSTIKDQMLGMLGSKNKNMIERFENDPYQLMQDLINQGGASNNRGLRALLQPFIKGDKYNSTINKTRRNPTDAANFDVKFHTSVTEVIPGLLSKILAATEGGPERIYDFVEDKWSNATQLTLKALNKRDVNDDVKSFIGDFRRQLGEVGDKSAFLSKAIKKDKSGGFEKSDSGHYGFKDAEVNQAVDRIMNNYFKSADVSIWTMRDASNPQAVLKRGLDKGIANKATAEMAFRLVQEVLRNMDTKDLAYIEDDRLTAIENSRSVYEDNTINQLDRSTINMIRKFHSGEISKKELEGMFKSAATGRAGGGFSGGANSKSTQRPKQASAEPDYATRQLNKQEATKYANKSSIYGYEGSVKKAIDLNGNDIKDANVTKDILKLRGANMLFNQLYSANLTAQQMAAMHGQSASYFENLQYVSSPDDLKEFIKDDGTVDEKKFLDFNARYTKNFLQDINKNYKTAGTSKMNSISVTDPLGGISDITRDIFSDPAIAKKLSIGAGSVTGLALGKMINNKTFIKSPMAGYLLGSLGASVMSMEKVQSTLYNILGSDEKVAGGHTNRDIFLAKMTQWLPSIGLGGKAGLSAMKLTSSLGPLGLIAAPLVGLTVGTAGTFAAKGLLGGISKLLFGDSNETLYDTKNESVFLKPFRTIGRAFADLDNPTINRMFNLGGRRSDAKVIQDLAVGRLKELDIEIADLEEKQKNKSISKEETKRLAIITKQKKDFEKLASSSVAEKGLKKDATEHEQLQYIGSLLQTGLVSSSEIERAKDERDELADSRNVANMRMRNKSNSEKLEEYNTGLEEANLRTRYQAVRDGFGGDVSDSDIADILKDENHALHNTVKSAYDGANIGNDLKKQLKTLNKSKAQGKDPQELFDDLVAEIAEKSKEDKSLRNNAASSLNLITDAVESGKLSRSYFAKNAQGEPVEVPGLLGIADTDTANLEKWWKSLSIEDKATILEYTNNQTAIQGHYGELFEQAKYLARVYYDKDNKSPLRQEQMANYLIKQALNSFTRNTGSKIKDKSAEYLGKISAAINADTLTDEDLQNSKNVMDKLIKISPVLGLDRYNQLDESKIRETLEREAGGSGSDDNLKLTSKTTKMKDLSEYKFSNGSKLSESGCSIVSLNFALNHIGLSGVDIEHLVAIANDHLGEPSGVKVSFFEEVLNGLGIENGKMVGNLNESAFRELKPSGSKAVILLVKNATNDNYHYINLISISGKKAVISDPERDGLLSVDLNTLVLSTVSVVFFTKKSVFDKPRAIISNAKDRVKGKINTLNDKATKLRDFISSPLKNIKAGISNKAKSIMDRINPFKGGASEATAEALSSINKVLQVIAENTARIDVRIIEDLTLPFQVTDKDLARRINEKQGSGAITAQGAISNIKSIIQSPQYQKEAEEQQGEQENLAAIAANTASLSGIGGAGGGSIDPNAEQVPQGNGLGLLGNFLPTILSSGKNLAKRVLSKGGLKTGAALAAVYAGYKGYKFFRNKAKGYWNNMLHDEDVEKSEGTDAHAADRAGNFSKFRRMQGAAGASLEIAGDTASMMSNGAPVGKETKKMVDWFKNARASKKLRQSGEVANTAADTAKGAGMLGKMTEKVKKVMSSLTEFFSKKGSDVLKKLIDKLPGSIKKAAAGVATNPKVMKKVNGLFDFMGNFLKKCSQNLPKLMKAGGKALRIMSGVGVALTFVQAGWSFFEGWRKAHLLLNREEGEVSIITKFLTGAAKSIYDSFFDLLASAVRFIPLPPGFGEAAILAITLIGAGVQIFGPSFEEFLEIIGIRKTSEKEETEEDKEKEEETKKRKEAAEKEESAKPDNNATSTTPPKPTTEDYENGRKLDNKKIVEPNKNPNTIKTDPFKKIADDLAKKKKPSLNLKGLTNDADGSNNPLGSAPILPSIKLGGHGIDVKSAGVSENALKFLKEHEGLRLKAYLCQAGVPTIGYGHTGPDVHLGMTITKEQADALFAQDVAKFAEGVKSKIKTSVTQDQFDALVSFAYNVGIGGFGGSTLLKKLNNGDYEGALAEFPKWNKAGGKVSNGLAKRRAAEAALFARSSPSSGIVVAGREANMEDIVGNGSSNIMQDLGSGALSNPKGMPVEENAKSITTTNTDQSVGVYTGKIPNYPALDQSKDYNTSMFSFGKDGVLTNLRDRVMPSMMGYRFGRPHSGIDFRTGMNEPIFAAADGVVVSSGWMGGGGNAIAIKHPDGSTTRYMHMNKPSNLKAKDTVKKGQQIGLTGKSGGDYAPHLHFEIKDKAGKRVDPFHALKLKADKIKLASSPENIDWMNKNKDTLSGENKSYVMSTLGLKEKPSLANNNTGASEKGGPGAEAVEARKAMPDENSRAIDSAIINLQKEYGRLVALTESMVKILQVIANQNTDNANNAMDEALKMSF